MYRQFNIQVFHVLTTQCVYVFCVYLRTNSDYFPIQHLLVDDYKYTDEWLFILKIILIFIYNLRGVNSVVFKHGRSPKLVTKLLATLHASYSGPKTLPTLSHNAPPSPTNIISTKFHFSPPRQSPIFLYFSLPFVLFFSCSTSASSDFKWPMSWRSAVSLRTANPSQLSKITSYITADKSFHLTSPSFYQGKFSTPKANRNSYHNSNKQRLFCEYKSQWRSPANSFFLLNEFDPVQSIHKALQR
jgi:hypothetical protein